MSAKTVPEKKFPGTAESLERDSVVPNKGTPGQSRPGITGGKIDDTADHNGDNAPQDSAIPVNELAYKIHEY